MTGSSEKGTIRVYCCGGTGINIGSEYAKRRTTDGYASLAMTYVDTSKSNLVKAGITESNQVFLLPKEDTDGSGKVRKSNSDAIADSVKGLISKHPAERFNVVMFSASGGSGSVFGPLIVQELLKRDAAVLAVVVGGEESLISANNTINTMKSLESISRNIDKPIVMFYAHNRLGTSRTVADNAVNEALSVISLLCSRQNDELDTQDIANWIGYHRSTSVAPKLSLMTICTTTSDACSVEAPIAIASLYRSPESEQLSVIPDYHCYGFIRKDVACPTDLHLVINTETVYKIAGNIQKNLDKLREQTETRSKTASLLTGNDSVSENNMVL